MLGSLRAIVRGFEVLDPNRQLFTDPLGVCDAAFAMVRFRTRSKYRSGGKKASA